MHRPATRIYKLEHRQTGEIVKAEAWMAKVGPYTPCGFCDRKINPHTVCYRIDGKLSHNAHWAVIERIEN